MKFVCSYCGEAVDPLSRETWHRVVGWERPGKTGGSDIALREKRQGWAHPHCVRLEQNRMSARQESLL